MAHYCPKCNTERTPQHITIYRRIRPSDPAKTALKAILRACNVCQTRLRRISTKSQDSCVLVHSNAFEPRPTNAARGVRLLFTNRCMQ